MFLFLLGKLLDPVKMKQEPLRVFPRAHFPRRWRGPRTFPKTFSFGIESGKAVTLQTTTLNPVDKTAASFSPSPRAPSLQNMTSKPWKLLSLLLRADS